MDAIDRIVQAIETARWEGVDVFAPDVVWDATVPDWRYQERGERDVLAKFAEWFHTPLTFGERERVDITADRVLFRFSATWRGEDGPNAAHQLHLYELRDGRVARVLVFCGGDWSPELQSRMAAAQAAYDARAAAVSPA